MSSHQRRLQEVAADNNRKKRNKSEKIRGSLAATLKLPLMRLNSGDIQMLPLLMFNSGDFFVAANRKGKNENKKLNSHYRQHKSCR
jgi:hypothetical protein